MEAKEKGGMDEERGLRNRRVTGPKRKVSSIGEVFFFFRDVLDRGVKQRVILSG